MLIESVQRPPASHFPTRSPATMTEPVDYFTLLDLPRGYLLDRARLEEAYERLTLENHPDFFATAGENVRLEAEERTAHINAAYRVLSDDLERADYLLVLYHGDAERDTRKLPEGFLQEMFMLQEEVDELGEGASVTERAPLREQCLQRLKAVKQARADLFGQAEQAKNGGPPKELLDAMQSNLNSERYLKRLLDRL